MKIPIFRSAHEGYGDSRRVSRRHSYHRNGAGFDARWAGELRIASRMIASSTSFTDPPVSAVEWEDSSGNPLVIITAGAVHRVYQDGSFDSAESLTTTATGACLHDDGASVPYLYSGYGGNSAGSKVQRRAIDGTLTTMTNLVARKLLSLGGDLYGTRRASSTLEDCQVWKIASGTSITQAIALPTGTTVGWAGHPINNLAGVRRKVVALKPEGIFTYDRGADLWINHARWLEQMPHPDNGKAFWYEGDDLIVALGNGGALRFNGEDAYPYDLLPTFTTLPDENTTPQIVDAGGSLRHWGVAVTKIGAKRTRFTNATATRPLQPVFAKSTDSGATWGSGYTSDVIDWDASSEAVLDALASATGKLLLLVGEPFAGFYLDVSSPNSNAATMAVEIWTGAAWTTVTVRDLTATPGGVSLARSGWVLFDGDPITDGWTAKSETADSNTWTGYAVRISFNANLDATVRIKGIDLIPWRPPIDASVSDFDQDGLDRAGIYPHVLLSRLDDEGAHIVHDLGALTQSSSSPDNRPDEIGAVLYAQSGDVGADPRALLICGRVNLYKLRLTIDDRPQMAAWQQLQHRGIIDLAGEDLEVITAKEGPFELSAIELDGQDWKGVGYVYARFLNGSPWARIGTFENLPARLETGSVDVGRWLQVAVGFSMTTTQTATAGVPRITRIDADVEPAPDATERRLPRQVPAVV